MASVNSAALLHLKEFAQFINMYLGSVYDVLHAEKVAKMQESLALSSKKTSLVAQLANIRCTVISAIIVAQKATREQDQDRCLLLAEFGTVY